MKRNHYTDPGFSMSPIRVPDDVYVQTLNAFIIVCADIVIIDRPTRTIYLAKRRVKPAEGWWWIGGRMLPAELPVDAARRNLKRETSLDLDPPRFELVSLNRYWFSGRTQPPQTNSCDTLGFTFAVELTPDERIRAAANLDPEEYDVAAGLQPCTRERLVAEKVRQPILDFYDAVC